MPILLGTKMQHSISVKYLFLLNMALFQAETDSMQAKHQEAIAALESKSVSTI